MAVAGPSGLSSAAWAVARAGWRVEVGCEHAFRAPGVTVRVRQRGDPQRWVTAVRLGDATLVSLAPGDERSRVALEEAGEDEDLTDPTVAQARLGAAVRTLGPARLAFLDPGAAVELPAPEAVTTCSPGAAELGDLLAACPADEATESSLDGVTSTVSTVVEDGAVLAAAGWSAWGDERLAHVGVLVRPEARGRGLGRRVATDALRRTGALGLVPQWRVREGNAPSLALAIALGAVPGGRELSLQLDRGDATRDA